jgi:energy-coupling factor transporter ATP-binding protein EcfA2
MATPVKLKQLIFNGGGDIDISDSDIVVLVGPNNSGKSRTLLEIVAILSNDRGNQSVKDQLFALSSVEIERYMDVDEFKEWLTGHRKIYTPKNNPQEHFKTLGSGEIRVSIVDRYWQTEELLGPLTTQLVRQFAPGDARNSVNAVSRIDFTDAPVHPVQVLVRDQNMMDEFESAFTSAFHLNPITDGWGQNIRIRVSRDENQSDFASTSSTGFPGDDLSVRLEKLPLIEQQSDGVRAYAGILLAIMAADYPILLLDEPETFLHPPQAKLLGEHLGVLRKEGQLVIATHSLDVLLGLLKKSDAKVTVVRLTRTDDSSSATTIPPDRVRSISSDALLRFSNVLDGLFHEGVVICEGDTDSLFYSAVAQHLSDTEGKSKAPAGGLRFSATSFDTLFTHTGGKHRIPKACKALVEVGVPVRVIADFDVLNDRSPLEQIVESLGSTYTEELEALRNTVDKEIRGREKRPTYKSVKKLIDPLLARDDNVELDKKAAHDIGQALKLTGGWESAKKIGKPAVPHGGTTKKLEELLKRLEEIGLFVVPVGAVESWVPTVALSGPAWIADVIESNSIEGATEAAQFVQRVLGSLAKGTVQ